MFTGDVTITVIADLPLFGRIFIVENVTPVPDNISLTEMFSSTSLSKFSKMLNRWHHLFLCE